MAELKDLIRAQRAKCGRTLEEIAKEVGVSKATVQRWESGAFEDGVEDAGSKNSAIIPTMMKIPRRKSASRMTLA